MQRAGAATAFCASVRGADGTKIQKLWLFFTLRHISSLTINCASVMRALNKTNAPQCKPSAIRQAGGEREKDSRSATDNCWRRGGVLELCWHNVLHKHHRLCGNTGNLLVKGNSKYCLPGTEDVSVLRYVLTALPCAWSICHTAWI